MTMNMEDLVTTFIKIREKKSQLKAEYDAKVAKYDEAANKIEALILRHFGEQGVESMKTPAGTAYTAIRSSVTMGDYDTFKAWADQQEDPYMYFERRPSKAAVEAYRAEKGELPPGVNMSETRAVNVRRS